MEYRKYNALVFLTLGTLLLPIALANLWLGENFWFSVTVVESASRWQNETKGIVSIPSKQHGQYKEHRITQFGRNIDTVSLGSSTGFTITEDMLPFSEGFYNASSSGHKTSSILGQALTYLDTYPSIKWMVIDVNWILGHVGATQNIKYERYAIEEAPPLIRRLMESISLARITDLADLIQEQWKVLVASRSEKDRAFHWIFDAYKCPGEAKLGKDFDTRFIGYCDGFRSDGSATLAERLEHRVNHSRQQRILKSALPGGMYYKNSVKFNGEVPAIVLDSLFAISMELKRRGGKLIIVHSPLLPGLQDALMQQPSSATAISRTKSTLQNWSDEHGVTLIDAGKSELFGCDLNEFIDGHHAVSSCYRKVFNSVPHQKY